MMDAIGTALTIFSLIVVGGSLIIGSMVVVVGLIFVWIPSYINSRIKHLTINAHNGADHPERLLNDHFG